MLVVYTDASRLVSILLEFGCGPQVWVSVVCGDYEKALLGRWPSPTLVFV